MWCGVEKEEKVVLREGEGEREREKKCLLREREIESNRVS
jgi:hypothetical protein